MEVRLLGTGGGDGWPRPGCRCASCARAGASGRRAPAHVLVDGTLHIEPGLPPRPGAHRVARIPGGWDLTAPDGGRLLIAEGAGAVPDPPPGTAPYTVALLDLLGQPAQLGALRARGLVQAGTTVAVLHADHRVPSEAELARRCRLWGVTVPHDGDVLARAAAPPEPPRRVLLIGGARSGKSREAELRLSGEPRVTYLAAGPYPAGTDPADAEWARRVAAHQAARPAAWRTVESADAAGVLRSESDAILFDGAGTWLAAVMAGAGAWASDDTARAAGTADGAAGPVDPPVEGYISMKMNELLDAWRQTAARVVAVSDDVGSGVVPASRSGRLFRDHLGWLNQRLAAEADEAVLVVAGTAMTLPS